MKSRIAPYPAISRGSHGSYQWAMDQLAAGNEVRRENWPIEVRKYGRSGGDGGLARIETAIWKLYCGIEGNRVIFQGFSNSVLGADNDSWGDLGMDSGGYYPKGDDAIALDWQLVADVTPEQIANLDYKTPRYRNARIDEDKESNEHRRFRRRCRFVIAAIILAVPLLAVVFLKVAFSAETASPASYSCAEVRAAVQWYGSVAAARRAAKRNGATREQIAAAEKCL